MVDGVGGVGGDCVDAESATTKSLSRQGAKESNRSELSRRHAGSNSRPEQKT